MENVVGYLEDRWSHHEEEPLLVTSRLSEGLLPGDEVRVCFEKARREKGLG